MEPSPLQAIMLAPEQLQAAKDIFTSISGQGSLELPPRIHSVFAPAVDLNQDVILSLVVRNPLSRPFHQLARADQIHAIRKATKELYLFRDLPLAGLITPDVFKAYVVGIHDAIEIHLMKAESLIKAGKDDRAVTELATLLGMSMNDKSSNIEEGIKALQDGCLIAEPDWQPGMPYAKSRTLGHFVADVWDNGICMLEALADVKERIKELAGIINKLDASKTVIEALVDAFIKKSIPKNSSNIPVNSPLI